MPTRFSRRAGCSALLRVGLLVLPLLLTLFALPPRRISADEGYATWYGQPFHGRKMANGQVFDMNDPTTTACNLYPFGTWLRVTNTANGKSITVQVRDRGRFTHALDLSYAAFAALDDPKKMRLKVTYDVVAGPGQSAPNPSTPAKAPAPSAAPPPAPTRPPAPTPTQAPAPAPTQTPAPAPTPTPTVKPAPTPRPEAPGEHVVAQGETLFSIARRFGVTLADLVRINNITNPDQVPVGQRLVLTQNPDTDQRSTPPQGPSTRSGAPTEPTHATAEHTVLAGETLSDIAVRYDMTPAELVQLNDLSDPDQLIAGQQLRIRGQGAPAVAQPTAAAPTPAQSADQAMDYTVQEGETLWDIAAKFQTTPDALVQLNGLSSPDLLAVGQSLRVAAPSTVASAPAASARTYVVQDGDTLSSVAARFDTTTEQLQTVNNMSNPDLLQPGQMLNLP